jgi:hypothetical protein
VPTAEWWVDRSETVFLGDRAINPLTTLLGVVKVAT